MWSHSTTSHALMHTKNEHVIHARAHKSTVPNELKHVTAKTKHLVYIMNRRSDDEYKWGLQARGGFQCWAWAQVLRRTPCPKQQTCAGKHLTFKVGKGPDVGSSSRCRRTGITGSRRRRQHASNCSLPLCSKLLSGKSNFYIFIHRCLSGPDALRHWPLEVESTQWPRTRIYTAFCSDPLNLE